MSLIPPVMPALLQMDAVLLERPAATSDAEGDPSGARTTVGSVTRGTLSSVSAAETISAAQRGTTVNKALALPRGADIQEGDLPTINAVRYEVVGIDDRRLYRRALLKIVR